MFTLALALERVGGGLRERVGREPSGGAFDSIIQLESERGVPRNPLINPGAMVVTDNLIGAGGGEVAIQTLLGLLRGQARNSTISVDAEVAESEIADRLAQP